MRYKETRYEESRYKETRYKESRYKDENLPGKFPECGAIFMSNSETKEECFDRRLFGLPYNMSDFVLSVKKGMLLFLFEFENRLLYGVFRATSDGEINIQPGAYRKKFPAQVRVTPVWNCSPLAEHEFHDAIKDNYYSVKKFQFGLNQDQVDKLMALFRSKKISKNPERNVWRRGDKPAEGRARSGGDLRKVIVDRLRVVSTEDEHINLNDEKIVEVDKVSCGRKRDRFKKNHLRENDDFGDSGSWKKLPGGHLDHSLVGLKREADVGSHYMVDENNGHEFNNNHREIRGLTKDNFSMMEKTKVNNDIEDGYIPLYIEPLEEHYDEIGLASNDAKFPMDSEDKDIMDYNRLRDEYNVRKDVRQKISANYLGRSCDIGSRVITDEYFLGNDALETELRALNEHSLSKSFVDVSSSHLNQDTFWTACDPTIPYIPLNPSYLASDPSFIPLESRPIYPYAAEITPSFDSHNEASIQYFEENRVSKAFSREGSMNPIIPKFTSLGSKEVGADENYNEGHKSHVFSSGIIPFAASKDSYREEPTSKYVKKVTEPSHALKRSSSDADLCVHEEDSCNDRILYQTRDNKRVSVFARLKSDPRHEQEPETVKKHGFNASVDEVMKMLEEVVSSPTDETVKIKSVNKQDDDDDDNVVPDSVMELDADVAAESIEDELVVEETRVVDFKRRKKTNKDKTKCLGDATSDSSRKRRKLVRPAFVEKESTGDGVGATKNTDMPCEVTPLKDESCSMKVVVESKEQVDEKESTDDGISATKNTDMLCEITPFKDESCPSKVEVESEEQVDEKESTGDGIHTTKNTDMLCEITPFEDESCPTKVVVESKEQVDEKASTGEGISTTKTTDILCEITPFKDESCPMKVVVESKEQVDEKASTGDGISTTKTTDMLCEITPFKDCPTKVVVESKEQVDEKVSTGDCISATKNADMLCEVTPLKDESCPMKVEVESKEQVDEKASTGEGISMTKNMDMLCEVTPLKDESCPTKVKVESKEQVDEKESTGDGISATKITDMLCEITPFQVESCPTKVAAESKEQVDERESTGEGISTTKNTDMLCEVTPLKDESYSMKVIAESNEQVEEPIKSVDIVPPYEKTVLPTFNENTLFKDDVTSAECLKNVDEGKGCSNVEGDGNVENVSSNDDNSSTKAVVEMSEKIDGSVKLVQMPNECQKRVSEGQERAQVGDGNVENISSNDDNSSAKAVVEKPKKVDGSIKPVLTRDEGKERSRIEDGNAATWLASDVFVEVAQASSTKDDHKMCGWIFE